MYCEIIQNIFLLSHIVARILLRVLANEANWQAPNSQYKTVIYYVFMEWGSPVKRLPCALEISKYLCHILNLSF